jgi:hypothetical protein
MIPSELHRLRLPRYKFLEISHPLVFIFCAALSILAFVFAFGYDGVLLSPMRVWSTVSDGTDKLQYFEHVSTVTQKSEKRTT